MKPSIASVLAVVSLLAPPARGDDKASFRIERAQATVASSSSGIDLSLVRDSDGDSMRHGWLFGLTFKAPSTTVESTAQTRLDQFPTAWRVGLKLGKEFESVEREGSNVEITEGYIAAGAQWGPKAYQYFPNFQKDSASVTKSGWSFNVDTWYERDNHGAPWALEVLANYSLNWEDAKSVGLVTTDATTGNSVVRTNKVIDRPNGQAGITARVFSFITPSAGSAIRLGPSVGLALTSKKGPSPSLGSFSDEALLRTEIWCFYLPSDAAPANLRIGVAPFFDYQLSGSELAGSYQFGLLAQLRFGSPIFTY
jgi:hypothetical protein